MKKPYLVYGGIALGVVAVVATIVIMRRRSRSVTMNTMVSEKVAQRFVKGNADHLASLNPDVRDKFVRFVNDIQKMGYAVVITSSYRSTADQVRQKKANSKAATPGFSAHEYGQAIDLNLVKDGKWINQNSSLSDWKKTGVIDLARNKYGFRWCGESCGYHDPVHFDDTLRYPTKKLYAVAIKKYGSPEKIQGNKIKLAA